jgi:hypothetical protein
LRLQQFELAPVNNLFDGLDYEEVGSFYRCDIRNSTV